MEAMRKVRAKSSNRAVLHRVRSLQRLGLSAVGAPLRRWHRQRRVVRVGDRRDVSAARRISRRGHGIARPLEPWRAFASVKSARGPQQVWRETRGSMFPLERCRLGRDGTQRLVRHCMGGQLGYCRLRGQTMSEYSIYTITHDERSFSDSCAIVHCADDEEAIQTAEQWVDLHDVELWESNRFITRFSPTNLHMSS
jgi:hypothetical protein